MDEFPKPPGFDDVIDARRVSGGSHGATWLVSRGDGTKVVVKTGEHVPPGVFLAEAEGLGAIGATETVMTPEVLGVGPHHLVLTALLPLADESEAFWEEAGRRVAALHSNVGPAHGWHRDNWLGQLPQHNQWSVDGHEFFTQHRVLRFFDEPGVQAILGVDDLAGIERICSRFDALVPVMPPVFCHGDLWRGNMLATHDGVPVVADPAVAYTWAEVDISMMYCEQRPPDLFFDAYHEIHPAESGWKDRLELLHLRELLSVLAHYGKIPELCTDTVDRVRAVIVRYR